MCHSLTRLFCVVLIVLLSTVGLTTAQEASSVEIRSGEGPNVIPELDELASEWLDVSQINHMPSLHNFHEMAACAPSLLGVNYYPGGQLFVWPVGPRWFDYHTLPLVKLKINGDLQESERCRWYAYEAVRRKLLDGLEVETTVRLVFEGPGILYRVRITNRSDVPQSCDVSIEVPGTMSKTAGQTVVRHQADDPRVEVAHAFVNQPERLSESDTVAAASWKPALNPGSSVTLELAMAHTQEKAEEKAAVAIEKALDWARRFDRVWAETKSRWSQRWREAFTPGNPHFSGHLPTLVTDDHEIRDIYYRSILTLLVLHRTNLKMCDRVFITSGERDKGNVFYWDTSMWSKVFALLEPAGMRRQLALFLECDPHGGFVYDMDLGKQGDGWYAANDMTMFRLVYTYLSVTGDEDFVDEQVGDLTVLEHLEKLATGWRELHRDKRIMLADYGENENLLECAPMYVHRVPSFNAANVWMMRTVANIYADRGDQARAAELRDWADQIAEAVLGLYKPGEGVWHALHRDGQRVELRHCYDFVCIGKFMSPDLSPTIKREMVAFVERELLTDRWMRAMSAKDKAAAISDRPDHGPMGAFDAWPALTIDTMCELGAWEAAIDFLRRTQEVLYEGVYAQAREFYGPRRLERDAPVRIALRLACMRECVGGGAFAETIIGSLFGFGPEFGQKLNLREASQDRGFVGQLRNVRYQGRLLDLYSDSSGISFRYH